MQNQAASQQVITLVDRVRAADIPQELKARVSARLEQLSRLVESPTFLPEFDRINNYIDWIVSLPWSKRTEDHLDLVQAKIVLDKHHYGLEEIKSRVLEYLSVMKLKQEQGQAKEFLRSPILCFVGLVGTGKTTIAYSIAEAMGRKIARIPFGGMGDPLDLRGQSRMHPEAEPGKIIKALRATQAKNSVMLLDEIDRVTDAGRASIMGVLVELLDPGQNNAFVDHYIDYPVDLSECLFIATANNTTHIATAVLDRLEPIMMPSYNDHEKITIGKQYILPKTLEEVGLKPEMVTIDEAVWPLVVRPLGFDSGIRTLERTIGGVVRKVAREIVEGKTQGVHLTPENIKPYLPQL
jgi:ATP-dependent Lon protease